MYYSKILALLQKNKRSQQIVFKTIQDSIFFALGSCCQNTHTNKTDVVLNLCISFINLKHIVF